MKDGRHHFLGIVLLLTAAWQFPQTQKRHLPPPLRVHIPFEAAWKAMGETIDQSKLDVLRKDRAQGLILTRFRDYSSGPLTESQMAKIGEKPKLLDADWVRVKYQYEVLVELIQEKETVVTVYTNMQALKRDFLGGDSWVDIPSNGQLETTLLSSFGQSLFGEQFTLATPKKGFWEQSPGYVPGQRRQPRIVGPEREPH
ncbi:MAG: hypothetical protein ACE5JX_14020 [Acidobacteriota bacterium]